MTASGDTVCRATVSRSTFECVLDAPMDESTTRNSMQIEQIRGRYACAANRELSRTSGAAPECFIGDLAIKVGELVPIALKA